MKNKRLGRSRKNRVFFGVAAGLAEYSGRSVNQVRVFFIIATLLSIGTITIGYLALAFFLPLSDDGAFDINDFRVQ